MCLLLREVCGFHHAVIVVEEGLLLGDAAFGLCRVLAGRWLSDDFGVVWWHDLLGHVAHLILATGVLLT